MKTYEEQIKEMAQCMCGAKDDDICQNGCSKACGVWKYAERAIAIGYRKQSDIVKECLQVLRDMRFVYMQSNYSLGWNDGIDEAIEQLAKKYCIEEEVEK